MIPEWQAILPKTEDPGGSDQEEEMPRWMEDLDGPDHRRDAVASAAGIMAKELVGSGLSRAAYSALEDLAKALGYDVPGLVKFGMKALRDAK